MIGVIEHAFDLEDQALKQTTFIVAYSGGLGSFLAAHETVKEYGPGKVKLVFCDTKTEDQDLYRFVNETSKFLKAELVTLCDGRNVWEVFNDVKFMGNNRIDPCSKILKRDLFSRWIKQNHLPEKTRLIYGIDFTEIHRLERLKERWKPYRVYAPLCRNSYEKQNAHVILNEAKIKPPRLYDIGFPHNNCGGFCVKTGQAQFKLLWEKMPERYLWHEERQEELFKKIGQRGFIRKTENKKLKYLSMKEFRENYLLKDKKIDNLDYGGCDCFI